MEHVPEMQLIRLQSNHCGLLSALTAEILPKPLKDSADFMKRYNVGN